MSFRTHRGTNDLTGDCWSGISLGWQALVIWAILIPVHVTRAGREEKVLAEAFGAEYEMYRSSTWF